MQLYVAERDFLCRKQVFSLFWKKMMPVKPEKVKIVLCGKMFYLC